MSNQPDFRALLARARQKFSDYEMDTEEPAPYEHRKLMKEIDAALKTPPITPIPISERLPGAEDCHPDDGWCWVAGALGMWMRVDQHKVTPPGWRVWLPHWAISLPEESK